MIKSMTGYGKAENTSQGRQCQVEARSVNHRFLDLKIKLPKEFLHLEEPLKKEAKLLCERGKLDIHVSLADDLGENKQFIEPETLQEIKKQVGYWEAELDRSVDLRLSDIMQLKAFFEEGKESDDSEEQDKLIQQTVKDALTGLVEMRTREGDLLSVVIKEHISNCRLLIKKVPLMADDVVKQYKNKLIKNFENLEINFDEADSRIIQEMGMIADRCDVTEEVNRFQAHLQHVEEMLEAGKPVGRKLDFLMQELNREANTLCSKGNNTEVVNVGVDLKCEVEKMREQILNIE